MPDRWPFHPGTALVARTTAARAVRSGALWGALFGLLVVDETASYRSTFPTAAARRAFAATFGHNAGLAALAGPARRLDTVAGMVAWRTLAFTAIVGAIWGLLTATRLLRGEEEAGRWELVLSGRTTGRRATGQALAGVATGWLALVAVTGLATAAVGAGTSAAYSLSAAFFYATATGAGALMFLAVGALASQLAGTRRQANALAAGVLGAAYLVRMVADAGTGLAWLRWASPLGWVEELRPLTGSRPLALLPVAGVVAVVSALAVLLAGRRDVGTGTLGAAERAVFRPGWLSGPVGLAALEERWVVTAWVAGLGLLAAVFGLVAGAAERGGFATTVARGVARLGGSGNGPRAWMGYELVYLGGILAFAVGGQLAALRREEADGRLDQLLARPVGRTRWLAGRLAIGVVLLAASGLAVGIGGWVGLAGHGRLGLATMLLAGLDTAVPGLFVLGLATLCYGVAPQLSVPVAYLVVVWSVVVSVVGPTTSVSHWVLDTAVSTHLGPVPAAGVHWAAVAVLVPAAIAATGLGLAAFPRRDLLGG